MAALPEELTGPSRLARGLVAVTYALLIVGASVRAHGAGLACPDWPLCFGEVIPPIDFGVAFEFGHRVLAGLVSIGYLALLGWMARRREAVGDRILGLGAFGLAVLGTQVVLGGLTVWELLAEWTVTSHLLAGNTFCLTLLLLALSLHERAHPVERPAVGGLERTIAVGVAVLLVVQLALGGLVSSSFAGLACGTWPTCDGTNWFPTFQGLVGLQLVHRLVAYALVAAGVIVVAVARSQPRLAGAAWSFLGLVLLQAAIGVANVLLRLPVEVTLLHTAGAAGLVLCTTWLNWEVWRSPTRAASSMTLGSSLAVEQVG